MKRVAYKTPARFSDSPNIEPSSTLGGIFSRMFNFKLVGDYCTSVDFELNEVGGFNTLGALGAFLLNNSIGDPMFSITINFPKGIPVYTFKHNVHWSNITEFYDVLERFILSGEYND